MSAPLSNIEKKIIMEIELAYQRGEITESTKETLVHELKPLFKRVLPPINKTDWDKVAEHNRNILNDPIVKQVMLDVDLEQNREKYEALLEEHEIMDYQHGEISVTDLRKRYRKIHGIID